MTYEKFNNYYLTEDNALAGKKVLEKYGYTVFSIKEEPVIRKGIETTEWKLVYARELRDKKSYKTI